MFTSLMPNPKQQYFGNNGTPLPNGKVYTYAAGTSTPKQTFTDSAGTTPQANPIILNTRGEPANAIFWSGSYKVEVRDSLNNIIYTVDNYNTDPAGLWTLVATLLTSAGASMIGFIQAGAGAVLRTVLDKLRETVSAMDFGMVADGVTDDLPALNLAIASLSNQGTFVYPTAGRISLPRGKIYLNGTLTLNSSVHLIGHSRGQRGGDWATQLIFPANTVGIVAMKANTGPNQNGADASILEGLSLLGSGTLVTAHGVDMQARIKMRDCTVASFGGNGVNIVADSAARKNANCWELDTCSLQGNGEHGLYVQGGDANAGYAKMVDTSNNGRYGIYDNSFLGNTYDACHTDGNGCPLNGRTAQVYDSGSRWYVLDESLASTTQPGTNAAVWGLVGAGTVHAVYPQWVNGGVYVKGGAYALLGANAPGVLNGCYSESAQPPSVINSPSCLIGGLHGAGIIGTGAQLFGAGVTKLKSASTTVGVANIQVGQNVGGDAEALLALTSADEPAWPFRMKYVKGRWETTWANSTAITYMMNAQATIANGYVRDFGVGINFPNGIFNANKRQVYGQAAPTTGTAERGDTVFNNCALTSTYAGWICTVQGTPGTWKQFGATV